jgi:hypothetical protein
VNDPVGALRMSVLSATQPLMASDVGHATFYGACTGLIIAVLVVLYFGEKIIPPDQHGPWAIYLGAIIGAVLLTPLLVLGGFIPDTSHTRMAVVGGTLLFLLAASRVVVRNWGLEDGRRQAAARQPRPFPAWDASAVLSPPEGTAAALTERERAAQVFAAAAHLIRQLTPDIVLKQIDSGQLSQEAERQVQLAGQWMQVESRLLAVSAGYPSAAVRRQVPGFQLAALTVMKAASELLTAARDDLGDEERVRRAEEVRASLMSLASAWDELVAALHAGAESATSSYVEQGRHHRPSRPRQTASRRRLNGSASVDLTLKRQRRGPRLR